MNQKIIDLERVIKHLDSLYEVGDDCIHPDTDILVTDGEYDAMRRELAKLNPNSTIFSTPTASSVVATKKVKHNPPMTSISKASHEILSVQEEQLFKWIEDCYGSFLITHFDDWYELDDKNIDGVKHQERKYQNAVVKYPAKFFYQSYKLDGVACALYYEKGVLVAAGLRPRNGIDGEEVTEQVKYVSGVTQKLNLPLTCTIRGEIICKLSDFEKVQKELTASGEKLRANPRNHAAGGIRQFKDPSKVKDQRLSFIGYTIEGLDSPPYETEQERAKWCNKKLGVPFVQVREFNFYDLATLEKNVSKLDYEVDGVVIGVDNLEDQEQLGRHGNTNIGNPKGKIAWKFAEERAFPVLKEKEWKTGRTGNVKPVAIFDHVSLAGTQVSRATLHNIGFIFRNQIGIGTKLIVLKAGKIIPKVVGVQDGLKTYAKVEDVDHPANCPSCNSKLVIHKNKNNYELVCESSQCPAQNINGLLHYLGTFGVLGLGESKVTSLVEGGVVKNPSDFYKLEIHDGTNSGLSVRQTLLVLAGIHMISSPDKYDDDDLEKKIIKAKKTKKVIPLWRLFACFGIEAAGKSAGKALVEHFGDFDSIRKAGMSELESVNDVGEKTAKVIFEYLENNKSEIDEILKYVEPELPKIGPLTGKSFVFTGGFADGKSYWEKLVESQGGKCGSSVSKTTTYVVEGTDAGSKADKARTIGIPIINADALKKILGV